MPSCYTATLAGHMKIAKSLTFHAIAIDQDGFDGVLTAPLSRQQLRIASI